MTHVWPGRRLVENDAPNRRVRRDAMVTLSLGRRQLHVLIDGEVVVVLCVCVCVCVCVGLGGRVGRLWGDC